MRRTALFLGVLSLSVLSVAALQGCKGDEAPAAPTSPQASSAAPAPGGRKGEMKTLTPGFDPSRVPLEAGSKLGGK